MLVCVGDLLEEVLVRLRGDPVRGADTQARSARVRGGSAANVAAIDAELGGTPRFVGQVGDDNVGRTLTADLEVRGVQTHITHAGGTGIIVTMIGPHGRSRLIDRGTARRLSTIDPAVLDGATQLYLAASAFTEDPFAGEVDRLLGHARDQRLAVALGGPGSTELESLGADAFVHLTETVAPDAVVLNRVEHSKLVTGPRDPLPGATSTIVTNGSRPTLVIGADRAVTAVEVPPVESMRDQTGIGDGFLAGFLASRRTGADPVAATYAGHRVAARVLAQLGPTIGATHR